MGQQAVRAEHAVVEQPLQRAPAVPFQRTLDGGQVLVDVGLEDGSAAAAQLRDGGQGGGRRGLRDRHRQGRVHEAVVRVAVEVGLCPRDHGVVRFGAPSGRRSLQIMPRTQRMPASPVASATTPTSGSMRVPASQTVVKPPRSDSSAASLAAR